MLWYMHSFLFKASINICVDSNYVGLHINLSQGILERDTERHLLLLASRVPCGLLVGIVSLSTGHSTPESDFKALLP